MCAPVTDTTSAKEIAFNQSRQLIKVGSPSNQHWEMQCSPPKTAAWSTTDGMTTKGEVERRELHRAQGKGNAKAASSSTTAPAPVFPFRTLCACWSEMLLERKRGTGPRLRVLGPPSRHLRGQSGG